MQWEPCALLEAMHKPVDLMVLNTRPDSHRRKRQLRPVICA
jgi:hypothetical protein